ncbi:hypothetical protein HYZ78_04140 [Candidatus Microgenomates bacterium]|nr:hypothetical protein [Candidatus Microgenomates bacterium]
MSAELPIFEWYGDRREFLRGAVRLGGGTAGTIYLAPFLAGCTTEPSDDVAIASVAETVQDELPQRFFNPEWIRWRAEKESERKDYLFGQIAEIRWDEQKRAQRLFISDILGGPAREIDLPIRLDLEQGGAVVGRAIAFSPDGSQLAVAVRTGSGRVNQQNIFVVDVQSLVARKIYEGASDTESYLAWSQDSKKLLAASYPHAIVTPPYRGEVNVLDVESGRPVYREQAAIAISFSPDGKWVVTDRGFLTTDGRPLRVDPIFSVPQPPYLPDSSLVNLDTGKRYKVTFQGNLKWSADGKYLAAARWPIAATSRGGYFNYPGIDVFDLVTGEEKSSDLPFGWDYPAPISISPDNKQLIFSATIPKESEEVLTLLNLETQEIKVLLRQPQAMLFSFGLGNPDFYSFLSSTELLMVTQNINNGDIEVKNFDLMTGNISLQYSVKPEGWLIRSGDFGLEQITYLVRKSGGVDLPGEIQFFNYSKKDERNVLLGTAQDFPPLTDFASSIEAVSDGQTLSVEGASYIFANGRLYESRVDSSSVSAKPASRRLLEQVPRSENKLDFGPGDILVGPGGRSWYLQNGGRYEIPGRVEDFVQKRHKNMKAYEVPGWVLDKILVKELPERFFLDQYGRLIDGYADRLLVLTAGVGQDSDGTVKTFERVVKRAERLLPPEQILYGSLNVHIDDNGVTPLKHGREQSVQFPEFSINALSHHVSWLKKKAPLAQVVMCGHSQGGYLSFNVARSHPDYICRVITINSPLKGADRVVTRFLELEELVELCAAIGNCQALDFYADIGDDPVWDQRVENFATELRNRNVEVFTFSAERDPWVRSDYAIIKNSNDSIGNRKVRLRWDLSDYRGSFQSVHGAILDYDPFIEELAAVIGRAG